MYTRFVNKGKESIIYNVLIVLLCLCAEGCSSGKKSGHEGMAVRMDSLEQQIKLLTEKSKEATVVRRVSEQLEEIAYQQKDISDVQRQEALYQKQEAEQMRSLAELENEHAQMARKEALEAFSKMEEQKKLADQRREEAVKAQLKTDTLARVALGRSLATQAMTLHQAGNKELSSLLAYSSWVYTNEYRGDIYQATVFDALNEVSETAYSLSEHRGAIRDVCIIDDGVEERNSFVTVSEWGEIILWSPEKNTYKSRILFFDDGYDFRQVSYSTSLRKIIAASYAGELVVLSGEAFAEETVIHTESKALVGLDIVGTDAVFVTKSGVVSRISVSESIEKVNRRNLDEKLHLKQIYKHSSTISCQLSVDNHIWLGDADGSLTVIDLSGKVISSVSHKKGVAMTSISIHPNGRDVALGFMNGIVRTVVGGSIEEHFGHLSRVNALTWVKEGIVSVSNDRTIRLWPYGHTDNQSVVLSTAQSWVYCVLPLADQETMVCGGASNLVQIMSSSPYTMADVVHRSLRREFTPQEWEYYIGEVAPYRTFR